MAIDGNKIVCVPACFRTNPPDSLEFLSAVPSCWYVIADGQWKPGRGSFIADSRHEKKAEAIERNEIKLWELT
jgi:hypothetical protein